MPSELEELVSFLHSPQPAVVQIALDNLVGFSLGAGQQVFAYDNYTAIADLKALTQDSGKTTVSQLVTILINLCDDTHMRGLIAGDLAYVKFLVGAIVKPTNLNADLMTILLANLAKNDAVTGIFDLLLDLAQEQQAVFASASAIDCLMDCFVKGADRLLNKYANYDYLAYFFADVSRFERGRSYFVTEQPYDGVVPIAKLLVFTEKYDLKIRREGVASTIKNSLFDVDRHAALVEEPVNILPYILLPLAGPEEMDDDDMFSLPEELQLLPADKQRDPVDLIVCTHLESLLLLCTSKETRQLLRDKSVYPLVRELHKAHQSEDVAELCDRLVQLLMRDEGQPEEADDEIVEVA